MGIQDSVNNRMKKILAFFVQRRPCSVWQQREAAPEQAIQSPIQELAEEALQCQPEAQVISLQPKPPLFATTANILSSRKSEHLLVQLAGNNLRPLGSTGCEGVPDQMDQGALSDHSSDHFSEVKGGFPTGRGGDPDPIDKASSCVGPSV